MEKIVIDDNYKIESSEELSEKLTYKLLKEALKHYSTDRLEFKDKEAYKIFTVKIPGRKVNKKSKFSVVLTGPVVNTIVTTCLDRVVKNIL